MAEGAARIIRTAVLGAEYIRDLRFGVTAQTGVRSGVAVMRRGRRRRRLRGSSCSRSRCSRCSRCLRRSGRCWGCRR
jgi:hypothetical protein